MIVGVVGSRKLVGTKFFPHHPQVVGIIGDFLSRYGATLVVSGGALGVDSTAEFVASMMNIRTEIYRADWDAHGKAAGFLRNGDIAKRVDHLLAITIPGGSSGTKDTISKTLKLGKPVTIWMVEPLATPQPDLK